jgi:Cof subfamily protein (haloacid dehalogenase superfamily)
VIKLVVTDMDGTLLHNHATSVNPEYFSVIRELKEKGVQFCVASGRQYSSLQKLFAPVKDDLIYITENGTEIIYKDRKLFSMPMSMEVSRQLVLDTRAVPGAESMYCVGDMAFFEKGDENVYTLMKEEYHFKCTMVDNLLKLDQPCLKFSLYLKENVDEITAQYFTPKWKKTHEVACGGKYFMDVMERGANKGTALYKVQKFLGIRKEETAAFGDNHNDLEMLEEAGFSYAVANARKEVKETAKFLIKSNNEDGELWKLKELLEDFSGVDEKEERAEGICN